MTFVIDCQQMFWRQLVIHSRLSVNVPCGHFVFVCENILIS